MIAKKYLNIIPAIVLMGCAAEPEDVPAAYVSPNIYNSYDCEELMTERQRLVAKVAEVSAAQSKKATNDAVATGVGVVLFWPALFFLAAGTDREAELSALKGNYDAITEAGIKKKCLSQAEVDKERAAAEAAKKAFEEQQKTQETKLDDRFEG